MNNKKYFILRRMCGKVYLASKELQKQRNGFLLAELLVSSTIICVALLTLLTLMGTSIKWWQQWQIANEVYLDATTTRLTIANYTKQSSKLMATSYSGNYLLKDGFRQYGVTDGKASRILRDGQAQAISATSLSPQWGKLIVAPVLGAKPFWQPAKDGPIRMHWRTYVEGRAQAINGSTYEQLTDVTIYPNISYFGFIKSKYRN